MTDETSQQKAADSFEEAARLEQEFLNLADWYEAAIEEGISVLLEAKRVLEKDSAHSHTMIRSLSSRLKTPKSIIGKMKRFNFPLTFESMQENLQDIAGIRIVCSYIYDIYALRRWLLSQTDFELIVAKDYISSPKPSGYRSLHLIFNVPVVRNNEKRMIPMEIQIRTTAMDSWASLEHQLRYKAGKISDKDIHKELRECADLLYETDQRMQKIFLKLSFEGPSPEQEADFAEEGKDQKSGEHSEFDKMVQLAIDEQYDPENKSSS